MTRINLVPVYYLTNRHLLAEYLEIRHVAKLLERSLRTKDPKELDIPPTFRMGTGHVKFFYNKGHYLLKRFSQIKHELLARGFNLTESKMNFDISIFEQNQLFNDWIPGINDLRLVSKRIKSRILEKPYLYKDKNKFLDYCDTLKI